MVKGYYKCECGKEFNNPQKFNGHKSQCVVHLTAVNKLQSRNAKLVKFQLAGLKANQNKSQRTAETKQTYLLNWISEHHVCEKCGKVMTEKFGSGRFCSASCAHTHPNPHKKLREPKLIAKWRPNVIQREKKSPISGCKKKRVKKIILNGQVLAQEIDLQNSPYSEYNTAFVRKQIGKRLAYEFCLYEENKLIKSEVVLVYRYLLACQKGRKLQSDEVVHHIDGNELNNDLSNLEVLSRSEHNSLHARKRAIPQ